MGTRYLTVTVSIDQLEGLTPRVQAYESAEDRLEKCIEWRHTYDDADQCSVWALDVPDVGEPVMTKWDDDVLDPEGTIKKDQFGFDE